MKALSLNQREAILKYLQLASWATTSEDVKKFLSGVALDLDQKMTPVGEKPLIRQNATNGNFSLVNAE